MRRSIPVLLSDALEASAAIGDVVSSTSLEEYKAHRMLRSSMEREFLIIGEALGVIDDESEMARQRISHLGRIIGLRNRLAHAYDVIDADMLWSIATQDIPVLWTELRDWLADIG